MSLVVSSRSFFTREAGPGLCQQFFFIFAGLLFGPPFSNFPLFFFFSIFPDDYSKYLTKYQSYLDCQSDNCQIDNLRDHFHCSDISCFNKALSKKEEIIRHLKWHKKRSESLNHGFLRFSSSDDCRPQFKNCAHNRRQTHYHCVLSATCFKCYVSTSDVQMHSNYHRKDSAIIQEGFQRFRATEECNSEHCIFSGQRTTHFHCRRDNCKYTFKNKADMGKLNFCSFWTLEFNFFFLLIFPNHRKT